MLGGWLVFVAVLCLFYWVSCFALVLFVYAFGILPNQKKKKLTKKIQRSPHSVVQLFVSGKTSSLSYSFHYTAAAECALGRSSAYELFLNCQIRPPCPSPASINRCSITCFGDDDDDEWLYQSARDLGVPHLIGE